MNNQFLVAILLLIAAIFSFLGYMQEQGML